MQRDKSILVDSESALPPRAARRRRGPGWILAMAASVACGEADGGEELAPEWFNYAQDFPEGEFALAVTPSGDYRLIEFPARPDRVGVLTQAQTMDLRVLLAADNVSVYEQDSLIRKDETAVPGECAAAEGRPIVHRLRWSPLDDSSVAGFGCWDDAAMLGPPTRRLVDTLKTLVRELP